MRNQGLGSWIARQALIAPHRTALIFESSRWTYGELQQEVAQLAGALAELGVRRGDRVGYLGANHPALLRTLFASTGLGAIFVPVNPRLSAELIGFVLADAGCRVLLHGSEMGEVARSLPAIATLEAVVAAEAGDLVDAAPRDPLAEPVALEDVALLAYTSGTTGRPKGVMLTHANLTWNVVNMLSRADFQRDDITLATAPLYRMGGLGVTVLETLFKGGAVVLMTAPDPRLALELIERHQVTTVFGGPEILSALPSSPGWREANLSSVRVCVSGGAPVPERLIRAFLDRGMPFLQGYGLTEAAPVALLLDEQDMFRKVGSAGRPPFFVHLRVVHPDLRDVEPGEIGEILVQGPNVMQGYWNNPRATAEAITDGGWLHTGDAAWQDEDGYVYIVDRLKDAFVSAGERVFPGQIELALLEHPAIADAGVVSIADPEREAAGAAFVVRVPGSPTSEDELRAFLGGRLRPAQVPKLITFTDEIPRNPAGKVLRAALRQRLPGVS
jgi:acyl-CoA synthetase (AMP-forming)/AMP-acid ligase II